MARLLVHVEGQTEEAFVNEVLRDYLCLKGYESVRARIVGNPRQRGRGGIRSWPSVRKDIVNHLKEDSTCIATTMVDYYGMPRDGDVAWPGRSTARGATASERAVFVEQALIADISERINDVRRFIPFVVMHEFEALLFSDCRAFSRAIQRPDLEVAFQEIRNGFVTPEEINDSAATPRDPCASQVLFRDA